MTCAPISAIIPFYNGHAYIGRAIASIEAQTLRPSEIIIVDDGSERPFRMDELRCEIEVRVVHHGANRGIPAARNTGISAAAQPWLAFLDQDDEWLPERLDLQWRSAIRVGTGNPSLHYGRACVGDNGDRRAWPSASAVRRLNSSSDNALRELLSRGNVCPLITLLVHRTLLQQAGGFDPRWRGGADDYALGLRLAADGVRFHVCDSVVAIRHETGQNYSRAEAFLADDLRIVQGIARQYRVSRRLEAAALAAAYFRCGRALARVDSTKARQMYDQAIRISPVSMRTRIARALLPFGPALLETAERVRGRMAM